MTGAVVNNKKLSDFSFNYSIKLLPFSDTEEALAGVSLKQPFRMQSACGTPQYTNFTHAFAACLDYIFYQSDRLDVEQVVPLPALEELKSHIAIPSVVFPSDHVALVADLRFKLISENAK